MFKNIQPQPKMRRSYRKRKILSVDAYILLRVYHLLSKHLVSFHVSSSIYNFPFSYSFVIKVEAESLYTGNKPSPSYGARATD